MAEEHVKPAQQFSTPPGANRETSPPDFTGPPSPNNQAPAREDSLFAPPPGDPPLGASLLNLAVAILIGLLAWLGLRFILWLFGVDQSTAFVISAGGGLVAFLAARYTVRWPLPRRAEARQPQLPPNMRHSESGGREVVETVVFVVVLVLLLKSFAAEAFVIPTGSMATTLLGYNKEVECPSCHYEFPVNCSSEVDPSEGQRPQRVTRCVCPNCRQHIHLIDPELDGRPPAERAVTDPSGIEWREILDPGWKSGDRVLVGKFLYGSYRKPGRLDVGVFKYPEGPQKDHVPMNYIKRIVGLPGEIIAIHAGDVFRLPPPETGRHYPRPAGVPVKDLWRPEHMHADEAVGRFPGEFEIIRKPPEVLLAMMRIVYDNDFPAEDLRGELRQRWRPEGDGWAPAEDHGFRHGTRVGDGEDVDWLHYHHVLRGNGGRPSLVTDFMGYNSPSPRDANPNGGPRMDVGAFWVGDLTLECEVKIERPEGKFILSLNQGADRFEAEWDLASDNGLCTLTRVTGGERVRLGRQPTRLRKGTHRLRFANVDHRLTVWVDDSLPFGDGVAYEPPGQAGPTEADFQPAGVGARGAALEVRKFRLFRDTYYTPHKQDLTIADWSDLKPRDWERLRDGIPAQTFYVQPGHYLALGDNSPESADSRTWGLVPERLLLGRALLVYYPFDRAGRIR